QDRSSYHFSTPVFIVCPVCVSPFIFTVVFLTSAPSPAARDTDIFSLDLLFKNRPSNFAATSSVSSDAVIPLIDGLYAAVSGTVIFSVTLFVPTVVLPFLVLQVIVIVPDVDEGRLSASDVGTVQFTYCERPV